MIRACLFALVFAVPVAASAVDLQPTFMAQVDEDTHATEPAVYDGFELQRLRLGLRAQPAPWFVAVGVLEYSGGKVSPFEVFLEATAAKSWHFSVGFRRTPMFHTAKDELIESLAVPELSLPVRALWPGVDLGADVHYTPESVPVEGWLRVGNGSQSVEGNDGPAPAYDARGDVVLGKARTGYEESWWGFRAGLGGHAKYRENTTGLSDTTPDGFLFYHPTPTYGWQTIGEAHAAAWIGRWTATLEAGIARENRATETETGSVGASLAPIYTRGASLEVAWTVWGPPRQAGQPRVPGVWPNEQPLSAWNGGSVEVAARMERVDLEYGAPDVRPGGAEGGAVAVDWWATSFAALSLAAYGDHFFQAPIEEPNETTFWLVIARATVSFR